jgi:hypothetical protein
MRGVSLMSKNPVSLISIDMLEKESKYFQSNVIKSLKNHISWMNMYLNALYEDIGVTIDPEERLGFSPKKLLKREQARAYRAESVIASVRAGCNSYPQNSISATYRSLEDGKERIQEAVQKITFLYYDLEAEFKTRLGDD